MQVVAACVPTSAATRGQAAQALAQRRSASLSQSEGEEEEVDAALGADWARLNRAARVALATAPHGSPGVAYIDAQRGSDTPLPVEEPQLLLNLDLQRHPSAVAPPALAEGGAQATQAPTPSPFAASPTGASPRTLSGGSSTAFTVLPSSESGFGLHPSLLAGARSGSMPARAASKTLSPASSLAGPPSSPRHAGGGQGWGAEAGAPLARISAGASSSPPSTPRMQDAGLMPAASLPAPAPAVSPAAQESVEVEVWVLMELMVRGVTPFCAHASSSSSFVKWGQGQQQQQPCRA